MRAAVQRHRRLVGVYGELAVAGSATIVGLAVHNCHALVPALSVARECRTGRSGGLGDGWEQLVDRQCRAFDFVPCSTVRRRQLGGHCCFGSLQHFENIVRRRVTSSILDDDILHVTSLQHLACCASDASASPLVRGKAECPRDVDKPHGGAQGQCRAEETSCVVVSCLC